MDAISLQFPMDGSEMFLVLESIDVKARGVVLVQQGITLETARTGRRADGKRCLAFRPGEVVDFPQNGGANGGTSEGRFDGWGGLSFAQHD